jgi:tetratricopeptide (TPR) repeat protein
MLRPLLLALLLLAPAARGDEAETTDLARRHYQSGSAYFEEGRFEEAAREFRESYRLSPRTELLFNIAKCFDKKGDAARALDAYRFYLAQAPHAPDLLAIQSKMKELETQVGRVLVEGAPLGAELRVDGVPIGHAPLDGPLTATAGMRKIEARPIDGAPRAVQVMVPAGGEVTARLPAPKELVREVVKERVVMVAPTWYRSRLGWALAGAGAAVAIGGAISLGLAPSVQSSARAAATTEAAFRDADNQAHVAQYVGYALCGAGAAALVAGVVVFALRARADHPSSARLAGAGVTF